MLGLLRCISLSMARFASLAIALTATSFMIGTASQLAAQSSNQPSAVPQPRMIYVPGRGMVLAQPVPSDDPRAVARPVIVPGYGGVYAVPVRRKDTRSSMQRCVDEEVAKEGGNLSQLAMGAIDLKCSQR